MENHLFVEENCQPWGHITLSQLISGSVAVAGLLGKMSKDSSSKVMQCHACNSNRLFVFFFFFCETLRRMAA